MMMTRCRTQTRIIWLYRARIVLWAMFCGIVFLLQPRLIDTQRATSIAKAQAATPAVTLFDQTIAAGLAFTITAPPPASNIVDMMTGGAAGDFNNDGAPDLFTLGRGIAPDRLFINDGMGHFTDEAAIWGVNATHVGAGVAVGDYNGDGWLDLYVTSHGQVNALAVGQHKLYQNQQGTGFANVAQIAGVHQSSTTTVDGFGAAFGDYDLDGDLDLAVAGWGWLTPGVQLFQNQGDGTFHEVTKAAGVYALQFGGFSPCFNDMDGDGWPELLVAGDFGSSHYFRNQRDGSFHDETTAAGITAYAFGMGSAVADLNNDGRDDWLITSIYDDARADRAGNRLYWNQGNHRFVEQGAAAGVDHGYWGWGAVAVDLNQDGWLDLVETNGWVAETKFHNNPGRLWLNNGDETFTEGAASAGFNDTSQGRGLLHLDYDQDGDQDIVVIDRYGLLQLYRNEINDAIVSQKSFVSHPPLAGWDQTFLEIYTDANDVTGRDHHWLRILLDSAPRSDLAPNGMGARIELIVGDHHDYRTINGCSNYLSQSELVAHFGVGAATAVDELIVHWPNGETTRINDVAVDQQMVIRANSHLFLPLISR